MNAKVYSSPYVSQGSAATDLRGGDSFNSSLLRKSCLNLTVKVMKIRPLVTRFCHSALGGIFLFLYNGATELR